MEIWSSLLILQNISQLRQHNSSPLSLLVQKSIKNPLMIPSFSLPFTSSILLPSCREHTRIILIVFSVKRTHITEKANPIHRPVQTGRGSEEHSFRSASVDHSIHSHTLYKHVCVPKASSAHGYARYYRRSWLGKAWWIRVADYKGSRFLPHKV